MKKALLVILLISIFLSFNIIKASSLNWYWGSLPSNFKIEKVIPLSENDVLKSGEYFSVKYEIVVKRYFWESESIVKDRIKEHFQQMLGKLQYEHPELRFIYAKYEFKGFVNKIFYYEYYYTAEIIGKVEGTYLAAKRQLSAAVTVAIIIGLVLACIIATIVLVQQPAVQKLILASSDVIQKTSSVLPFLLLGLGLFLIAVPVIILVRR